MTRLICIDSTPTQADTGLQLGLELGKEYELAGVHKCTFTKFDVGILYSNVAVLDQDVQSLRCAHCLGVLPNMNIHYHAWRFIKLDPTFKLEDEEHERQLDKLRRHAMNYNMGPAIFNKLKVPNS